MASTGRARGTQDLDSDPDRVSPAPLNHWVIALLGIVTICAYGCWYYAFGVLLDPIILDTGWSETTLATSFSAGTVLVGATALAGGRLLDRVGHRWVFGLGAALTAVGLLSASWAESPAVFFVGAAIGLGASGALGFYHVTMPTAVRLNADGPRAIAVLTIWGAFSSAVFLPATAFIVERTDWRVTTRVLALVGAGAFALAAVALPAPVRSSATRPTPLGRILRSTVNRRLTKLFTLGIALGGIAMSTMLVYQVPTMTELGLGATTASSIAALRGLCQLLGRLPLTPIVNRLGLDRALIAAFGAVVIAGALLAVASTVPVGVAFAIVAGFGLGAFSPLQGMRTEALFSREDLGATMGLYGAVALLAGSLGPAAAGLLVGLTGDRRWAPVLVVVAGAGATLCFAAMARLVRTQ